MKGIDKTNPDQWREHDSPARSAELFLDFDPVGPEVPQEQSVATPMRAEHQAPSGDVMTVITFDDFRRLKALIRASCGKWALGGYINALERKLRLASIVFPWNVAADVVTMNSTVRVFDAVSRAHAPLTVVYPQEAGADSGSVSVLSILGTAILGRRAGESAGPGTEHGTRRFLIEKVLYQPEAAGDLHL